ncbi:type II toxin-antitoxin system VapC family toxin [Planctomycetota bacterium]
MSKYHNILDASALAKKYRKETGWDIIQSLFRHKDCTLHILNITIPEIVGAFVRWEQSNEIAKGEWKVLKDLFIADINNYKLVIHNITHRNIIKTDDVWETSMPVKPTLYQGQRRPRVGPNDVLVLSVGLELKTIYGFQNVYIFTSDNHMLKVADRLKIKTCDPEADSTLPF